MSRVLALGGLLGVASALLALSPDAGADIWKRVDANGITHFTNVPKGKGWKLMYRSKRAPAQRSSGSWKQLAANRKRYAPLIEKTARRYAFDANLIHAVVRAESAYNPEARSHKGAVGLMQLMPGTAQRYGVGDRRDPGQNLSGGVRYLRDLMQQFNNLTLALAAYNAGEGAVMRHGNKIPPYPETQAYVKKVIAFYRELTGSS